MINIKVIIIINIIIFLITFNIIIIEKINKILTNYLQ